MSTETVEVELREKDSRHQRLLFEIAHKDDKYAPLEAVEIAKIDVPGGDAFDRKELLDLADNIRRNTLINKPTVLKDGPRFRAIVGKRRLAAVQLLAATDPSVTTVLCHVRTDRFTSEADIAKLVLSENARRSANVLAELESINLLMAPPTRMTAEAIAASTGQTTAWVRKRLGLNKLHKPLLEQMRRGRLKFETGQQIAKLDKDQQKRVHDAFKAKLKDDPDAVVSGKDLSVATARDTVNLPMEMFRALPSPDAQTPGARLRSLRRELEDILESTQNMTAYARIQEAIAKIDAALEVEATDASGSS